MNNKFVTRFFIGSILFLVVALLVPLFAQKIPNIEQAQFYEVVGNTDDFSFAGRDRLGFKIVSPSANTFEQLAQTAMKAAIDMQDETNADMVYIKFFSNRNKINDSGYMYAMVDYAPDGGGNSGKQGWTWKVEAVESRQLKDTNLQVMHLLDKYRKDVADIKERIALIAKELGITYKQANKGVPRKKYEIQR